MWLQSTISKVTQGRNARTSPGKYIWGYFIVVKKRKCEIVGLANEQVPKTLISVATTNRCQRDRTRWIWEDLALEGTKIQKQAQTTLKQLLFQNKSTQLFWVCGKYNKCFNNPFIIYCVIAKLTLIFL